MSVDRNERPNPKKNKAGENRESNIQIRPSTGSLKNQHQYPKGESRKTEPSRSSKNQLNPKSEKDHLNEIQKSCTTKFLDDKV